ncbi:MAG: 5-formyltetrahydrofolate cyclo-ligase [Microthrixaceae bacterium]
MLDVVVAPCTAVDEAGTRVGFGGGYYDRALGSASPRPAVVVVAFEAQVSPGSAAASRRGTSPPMWSSPIARTFRPRD